MRYRGLGRIRVTCLLVGAILLGCSDGHDHAVPSWRVRNSAIESYDPAWDQWHREESLPMTLGEAQGVVVGDHLYIAGGQYDWRGFLRLDLATGDWEDLPFLPILRMGYACAALGDRIHILGGWSPGSEQVVSVYDIRSEAWGTGPDLLGERQDCEAVTLDGRIYLVAGDEVNDPYTQSTLDVLDPGVGEWQALSPMPAFSRSMAMGTDGASIYVVARGAPSQDPGRLFVYDPGTDAWSAGPNMLSRTGGYVEGAMVRTLFFVCGNVHADRRNMLVYDTVRQAWDWVKPFRVKRGHPGLVASQDRIFVIGGW